MAGHAVAIGVFDGVHRGHVAVLEHLRSTAHRAGAATAVLTFDPHPAAVLRPDAAPPLLCDPARRKELLRATGCVDHVRVIPFDRRTAALSAEEFVRTELVEALRARVVVVGRDFRFGAGRAGDVSELERLGSRYGFAVAAVPLVGTGIADGPCSSTVIRRLIETGELVDAARLLGRDYELCGTAAPASRGGAIAVRLPAGRCVPAPGRYGARLVDASGNTHASTVTVLGPRELLAEVGWSAATPHPGPIRVILEASLHAPVTAALSA